MTDYGWKVERVHGHVDPNVAGGIVEGLIQKYGSVRPKLIVDESRPAEAALHPLFEWDDTIAAERFREEQGRGVLKNLVVISPATATRPNPVELRAFIPVTVTKDEDRGYVTIEEVLHNPDYLGEMLDRARRDLLSFERKYEMLKDEDDLASVFSAIELLKKSEDGTTVPGIGAVKV
jgi:hypothetical protein